MSYADYINLVINGLVEGLIIALPALALTLVYGLARFPNAATGDFVAVGGYAGLAAHHLSGSLVVAGLAGAIGGAAASVLAYLLAFRPVIRRSVITLLLTSIGVGFVIRAVLGVAFGHDPRAFDMPLDRAWRFGDVSIAPADLNLAALTLVTLALVFFMLYATPLGRSLRAIADDPDLARVSGIRRERCMLAMWTIAGLVCGIAGTVTGMRTVVYPDAGWNLLLPAFAAAVVGGLGNPVGAVMGALLLGVLQELSTPFVGFVYKIALGYVFMMIVLLLRPQGLFNRPVGVR
ncbi:branched-chain amino acid ABC transporter permease [Bordetella genomosp. 8]|uniref:Branched-chain amino acid ABC transporter permease n=1 Tax=Bordetella genomosp. 8 TaxID=1416806 RepID=A0A1W6YHR6_9BORD|nr:branched-chain amino acid ABC transporter permease [Bordetella genomosp. 8]ARP80581.1 branched-chain amino acid ABC transporter permease [Bordetella genomosp. 8]